MPKSPPLVRLAITAALSLLACSRGGGAGSCFTDAQCAGGLVCSNTLLVCVAPPPDAGIDAGVDAGANSGGDAGMELETDGGSCTDAGSDPSNCGSCGHVCPGEAAACWNGLCVGDDLWSTWEWPDGGPSLPDDIPATSAYVVDAVNGVVTDTATGLVWQQGVAPLTGASANGYTWQQALEYCEALTLGGAGSGWRLPSVVDLVSVVSYDGSDPAVNGAFLDTPADSALWTSTPYQSLSSGYAWGVSTTDGSVSLSAVTLAYEVRCVR